MNGIHRLQFVDAPHRNSLDYLSSTEIPIGIRNNGALPVVVEAIELVFQKAEGVPEALATVVHPCTLEIGAQGGLEYTKVSFRPPLLMTPYTNTYRISITYRECVGGGLGPRYKLALEANPYVIINVPPNFPGRTSDRASVFVSFKDPEDLELAELAAQLLVRAGFGYYMAREEQRLGSAYWAQKIEPAIQAAEGTLVIWTPNVAMSSGPVLRELTYSQTVGTNVGLMLEEGASPPDEYPAVETEYGGPFTRARAIVAFAEEIDAAAVRWRQGGILFG